MSPPEELPEEKVLVTTDEVAGMAIQAVEQMSPEEKAEFRAQIDRNLKEDNR